MRQLPALDMSTNVTTYWRSYVYVGVLTYGLGAFAVLIDAPTTPGPHRQALVILSGLSLIVSMGPFRLLGLRLVETRWSRTFFSSRAACTFVFVAVGAVLDGGVRRSRDVRRPYSARCTLPSSARVQPGLWATSQGRPSGSMKIPE